MNNLVCGYFQATNGLRQGDPLSPFLFVLMAKVHGRFIKFQKRLNRWRGISIHTNLEPISHSQFADDAILFGEASIREAKIIKEVLDIYERDSGQCMNKTKSRVYFINTSRWQ